MNNKTVFYIEPETKDELISRSKSVGLSSSAYLRKLLISHLNNKDFKPKKRNDDNTDSKVIHQLQAIGNNINQIAKKLNLNEPLTFIEQSELEDNIKIILLKIEDISTKYYTDGQ